MRVGRRPFTKARPFYDRNGRRRLGTFAVSRKTIKIALERSDPRCGSRLTGERRAIEWRTYPKRRTDFAFYLNDRDTHVFKGFLLNGKNVSQNLLRLVNSRRMDGENCRAAHVDFSVFTPCFPRPFRVEIRCRETRNNDLWKSILTCSVETKRLIRWKQDRTIKMSKYLLGHRFLNCKLTSVNKMATWKIILTWAPQNFRQVLYATVIVKMS